MAAKERNSIFWRKAAQLCGRERLFPKPIINQGYWATSWPSSRQIKCNERQPLQSLRFLPTYTRGGLTGCESLRKPAHGDQHTVGWCDEKFNAMLCIFTLQIKCKSK